MAHTESHGKDLKQTLLWWLAIAAAVVVCTAIVYYAMTIKSCHFSYDSLVRYVAQERAGRRPAALADSAPLTFDLTDGNTATSADSALRAIAGGRARALLVSDFRDVSPKVLRQTLQGWLTTRGSVWMLSWENDGRRLFAAVFDSDTPGLLPLVRKQLHDSGIKPEEYVLPGVRFQYPTARRTAGGFRRIPTADGIPAVFVQMTAPWEKLLPPPNDIVPSYRHTPLGHVLSEFYVDFGAQSAYAVDDVTCITFNVDRAVAGLRKNAQPKMIENVYTASAVAADTCFLNSCSWRQLNVDFSWMFYGVMPLGTALNALLRADIAIADATPDTARARAFFADAPALARAVTEVITAPELSPAGNVVFTAFIRGEE